MEDRLAADAGNAGLVVGRPVTAWAGLGLADLRVRLLTRERFAGEDTPRATAGDPFESLAWLIRTLSARGVPLPAGTLVTTGSLGPTHFLVAGDDAVLSIDGLGEVAVAEV